VFLRSEDLQADFPFWGACHLRLEEGIEIAVHVRFRD
jgi:hypothetical protein